ncbi:PREDICTED: astacin-like metalloendopeptidase [Elephantulus edwardii]|uniref:astacin-like metalloendopeptidase n=1 Tax=Elephantulus edwardii TaxID=28737 RepID=UPI0003F07A13|nr:PREDICTED: astacin-like metalloendopeptidase [Elephantulus edwardii]
MENVMGLKPWMLALLYLPGLILGAPSTSNCLGTCGTSSPEKAQESWDKDIPAINQALIPEETPEKSFLLEGDIIRPSPFRLFSAASNKWPKSSTGLVEIPFLLSSEYNELSRQVIIKAFAEFERLTCIRFVSYEGQRDFISIVPMSGCFSNVGRSGGMQMVSLAPSCLQKGPGIVLHELMHVLGFWHEHARADRDRYIRVNWNEILPGYEMNFLKARSSNMLVPYDYSSVMHYGRLAFSRRGMPTILPLWDPSVHIGQRSNLSTLDITRVLRFYNCRSSDHSAPGRGVQTHSSGDRPTPASRIYLQRLLQALLEPRKVYSRVLETGGQNIAVESGEDSPSTQKFSVDVLARQPQVSASTPSSRPGIDAPGLVLGGRSLLSDVSPPARQVGQSSRKGLGEGFGTFCPVSSASFSTAGRELLFIVSSHSHTLTNLLPPAHLPPPRELGGTLTSGSGAVQSAGECSLCDHGCAGSSVLTVPFLQASFLESWTPQTPAWLPNLLWRTRVESNGTGRSEGCIPQAAAPRGAQPCTLHQPPAPHAAFRDSHLLSPPPAGPERYTATHPASATRPACSRFCLLPLPAPRALRPTRRPRCL